MTWSRTGRGVRGERRGGRLAELNLLKRSFIISQVQQTLLERTAGQPETEPKLVARSETPALTAEEEKRPRQQS